MVYEKWDTRFNIEALRNHLQEHVLKFEPVLQSSAFGGWSVLSSDGSYKDGWHKGHRLYEDNGAPLSQGGVVDNLAKMGAKPNAAYIQPTEICHGYLKEIIEFIFEKGFRPRRARIIRLSEKMSSIWHRDAAPGEYSVRLHIPIVTNDSCFFETREEKAHLPADGSSYFLFVNREHRVLNEGSTPRYHLVMDVTDTQQVTTYHRAQLPEAPR